MRREQAESTKRDCPVWTVAPGDPHYPASLENAPSLAAQQTLYGIGDRDLLKRKRLGLICSVQCPGSIVIKTFDAIRELRDAGIVVAGGFHSPMEQECLEFLLRGEQPVIVCPAKHPRRGRLPAGLRKTIGEGRVLLIAPFGEEVRRTTRSHATTRSNFVAALSAAVLIPHASPGGNAEVVSKQLAHRRKPLFTFEHESNEWMIAIGARRIDHTAIGEHLYV